MTDPRNGSTDRPRTALDAASARGASLARRSFVFFGALFVAGCATGRATQTVASSRLPSPDWPQIPDVEVPAAPAGSFCVPEKVDPVTKRVVQPAMCYGGPVPFARPRAMWARGTPVRTEMDRMLKPRYVTVHHDGMTPFYGMTDVEAKARLELIRNGHRGKGWGDIGYHYIIDRCGNVWQGRDVLVYQGAHVRNRNEHNIGVMCLGNFVVQKPSEAQVEALNRTVAQLCAHYRIAAKDVYTHREWKGAQTACPGDNLQAKVRLLRKSGFKSGELA
jgi:hypothetical protein